MFRPRRKAALTVSRRFAREKAEGMPNKKTT
jgi:hypothetical protein